jgi:hypothetical protein
VHDDLESIEDDGSEDDIKAEASDDGRLARVGRRRASMELD